MQARHHVSFSEGDADLLLVSPSSRDVLDSKSSFTNDRIIFSATVESVALKQARTDDYIPGDLGFDPLGLYTGKAPEVQRSLELKELNNGRLAMLAITYYALEEFVTKASVVNDTPLLFKSFL